MIARVTPRTIARWIDDGHILTTRPIARGNSRRLVLRDSLLAFLGLEVAEVVGPHRASKQFLEANAVGGGA